MQHKHRIFFKAEFDEMRMNVYNTTTLDIKWTGFKI